MVLLLHVATLLWYIDIQEHVSWLCYSCVCVSRHVHCVQADIAHVSPGGSWISSSSRWNSSDQFIATCISLYSVSAEHRSRWEPCHWHQTQVCERSRVLKWAAGAVPGGLDKHLDCYLSLSFEYEWDWYSQEFHECWHWESIRVSLNLPSAASVDAVGRQKWTSPTFLSPQIRIRSPIWPFRTYQYSLLLCTECFFAVFLQQLWMQKQVREDVFVDVAVGRSYPFILITLKQ